MAKLETVAQKKIHYLTALWRSELRCNPKEEDIRKWLHLHDFATMDFAIRRTGAALEEKGEAGMTQMYRRNYVMRILKSETERKQAELAKSLEVEDDELLSPYEQWLIVLPVSEPYDEASLRYAYKLQLDQLNDAYEKLARRIA